MRIRGYYNNWTLNKYIRRVSKMKVWSGSQRIRKIAKGCVDKLEQVEKSNKPSSTACPVGLQREHSWRVLFQLSALGSSPLCIAITSGSVLHIQWWVRGCLPLASSTSRWQKRQDTDLRQERTR